MTTPVALTLLGFGLGVLLVAGRRASPRAPAMTLRDRALEAQKISASASQLARDLAEQWSAEQERLAIGGRG